MLLEKTDSLAKPLERAEAVIARRAHQSVQGVSVQEDDTTVVVRGSAPSFYAAQLALAAVKNLMRQQADRRVLRSAIEVAS